MAEPFTLDVDHNGVTTELQCELRVTGYVHKIAVQVNTTEVIFERDEEQQYRAIIADTDAAHKMDMGYLKAIAGALEEALG